MQLSKIMVGSVLTVLVMTGMFYYLGDAVSKYSPTVPDNYNDSFVRIINSYETLENTTRLTESKLNISTESNVGGSVDFLGYFFSGGYKAAQSATSSISSTYTMIDVGIGSLDLGGFGQMLKSSLMLIVLIVIVVGIILYLVTKSDRL